jgi:hypothetical protein
MVLSATAALAAALVLVLPGAAWLAWQSRARRDSLEWLADAVGISITLSALVALGAFLLRLTFSREALIVLYSLAGVILLAGLVRRRPRLNAARFGAGLLGLGAFVALAAWRLYQARSLALPAWVDSAHHVLIVQKILAAGGLPAELGPELPIVFSYHYAFHAVTALFAAITGLDAPQAVLWLGQVINALVAVAVYRLAKTLSGDWRAAGLAFVLVGWGFHMPAYYVTWGRYTLLTGLVMLPLALAAALRAAQVEPEVPPDRTARAELALFTAGVALAHYTTLWLLGLFLLVWGIGRLEDDLRARRLRASRVWVLAAAVGIGLVLAGPWLYRVVSQLGQYADVDVVLPSGADQSGYWSYILYLVGPLRNKILLGVAAAGLLLGLFRRGWRAYAVWGLILTLLTLPWGLRFPPFRPDHYAILLFLPAAPLAAGLVTALANGLAGLLRRRWERPRLLAGLSAGFVALAAAGVILWGGRQTADIINPVTVLARPEELPALDWVKANTPPDARFFVNTRGWQSGAWRGVDAGYWIPILTGRLTVVVPALGNMAEPAVYQEWSGFSQRASQAQACDEAFWSLARDAGLSYAYLRAGEGSLKPEALVNCAGAQLVYAREGVFIYELRP